MKYIIVGLGNPGDEYSDTRHNSGKIMLDALLKEINAEPYEFNKKINALVTDGKIGKSDVMLVAPQTFMNKSGQSIASLVTTMGKVSLKKAEKMIVIYDDFQLPL
jgi:PTH1 family peptidyl-tRNA hydrolase